MIYSNYTIYGPYTRKDKRQHVILLKGSERKTISYPKYLMELHLGRLLEEGEDVHHKDRNFSNNNLDNLELKNHKEHCKEHSTKYLEEKKDICILCGTIVILTREKQRTLQANLNRGKIGPFCSRKCSGKYGKMKQEKQL